MEIEYTLSQIVDLLKEEKFYIYGTGFVARRFYDSLVKIGIDSNIISFISTNRLDFFNGICVQTISSLNECEKTRIVCVAVHDVNYIEIEEILNREGYSNIVWIYPYIFDLWYGCPIKENASVDTKSILATCINEYRIPIRLLVVEEFYGRNSIGNELYIKAQSVHSSMETAQRRLEAFIDLIKSWDKNGYIENNCLKIDTGNNIFDGVHRLALAYYHGVEKIKCNIYKEMGAERYVNDEILLVPDVIDSLGLSKNQREVLDDCFNRMKRNI